MSGKTAPLMWPSPKAMKAIHDFQGAVSTIGEKDLPIALGLIPLLRFRSLHNEINADVAQIEAFQKRIERRLAKTKTVSLQPTAVCSTVVASGRNNSPDCVGCIPALEAGFVMMISSHDHLAAV